MSLCVFVSVCLFLMVTQTICLIDSKLGIGIEGHFAGKISLVSCTCVHRGATEETEKRGGVSFGLDRVIFERS